jgi:NAD+ kinase
MHFEIKINNNLATNQHGDGVIISTPTGSTGHSMSAGGPIVTPNLQVMCITSICPHTLSSRPIIVGDDSVIDITLLSKNGVNALADGINIKNNFLYMHSISIKMLPKTIKLIHPPTYNFFNNCANKLGWEKSVIKLTGTKQ